MKKTHLITIIIILVVLSTFTGGFLYFKQYLDQKKEYTYEGPGGSFDFEMVEKPGVNILFHRVYVYLIRDGKELKYYVNMRNGPMEVEDIPFENARDKILYSNGRDTTYFITQDPNLPIESNKISTLAVMNINRVTAGSVIEELDKKYNIVIYGIPTKAAITEESEMYKDTNVPVKDCNDATRETPVIKLIVEDENKIYFDESNEWCVILEAKSYEELLKVTDKFVYHILEVF